MFNPLLLVPPYIKTFYYQYQVPRTTAIDDLGSRVPPKNQLLTPEQKKRQIATTICAVSVITAIALVIAAYTVPMIPLLYGAVPLLVMGVGVGIWHRTTKRLKLDLFEDLEQIRSALKGLSFDKIMKRHHIHTILEYRLLDKVSKKDSTQKAFYNTVACIAVAYRSLYDDYQNKLVTANDLYSTANKAASKKDWDKWKKNQDNIYHAAFQTAISELNDRYTKAIHNLPLRYNESSITESL